MNACGPVVVFQNDKTRIVRKRITNDAKHDYTIEIKKLDALGKPAWIAVDNCIVDDRVDRGTNIEGSSSNSKDSNIKKYLLDIVSQLSSQVIPAPAPDLEPL